MTNKHATEFDNRQYMIHERFELYYYENTLLTGVDFHRHNYYEILFFVEGDVSMNIENTSYHLKSGDILIIPPNTLHNITNHDLSVPYRRFVFWLSRPYYRTIYNYSNDLGYIFDHTKKNKQYVYSNDLMVFNAIQSKLFSIIDEIHSDRYAKEIKIGTSIYDLMIQLNRIAYKPSKTEVYKNHTRLFPNIIEYIESHIHEELTLDSIAETFYVSKFYIAHAFKDKFGISVHKYIIKKRLQMVCDALMNNENITDVFHQYGFKDYSSFYKAFKKEYGYSPKEYKEKNMINA